MRRKFPFLLILILLVAWGFLTLNIANQWVGHQDANGAWISLAVRNYHWHGFFALNGMIDQNPEIVGVSSPYLHHPPLAVWLFALPTIFAGYDEAVIRFGAASCTLIGGVALFVLARRLAGQRFALWSAAFYLLTPMTAYFGRMPDHEAPALIFVILFGAALVNWLRRPTRREWWALVALTVLCAWTAWGALIVIGILGLIALFYTKRRLAIVMLAVVAVGAVIALIGYFSFYYPDTVNQLIEAFVWRTGSSSGTSQAETFTASAYVLRMLVRLITLYTPTVCCLALIGAWYVRGRRLLGGMIGALVGGGVAYILIFRNASYIHDYYLLYLTPGLALLAGAAPGLLPKRAPRLLRPLVVSLVIFTIPASLRYVSELYMGSDDPLSPGIAQVLSAETSPGDLIATNLPTNGFTVEYYAQRRVQWSVSLDTAQAQAEASDGKAYYYFQCGVDEKQSPQAIAHFTDASIKMYCELLRLN